MTAEETTVDAGDFELVDDVRFCRTYKRPADEEDENDYGIELRVQAWYDGWRVVFDDEWDWDVLAENFETKEDASEFAERVAREKYSN